MEDGIRIASRSDIPVLCEIWKACFDDSEDYINCFYRENFGRIKVLLYEADGKPVSMVNIFDAVIVSKEAEQPARFLYAVGTLSKYRKKGYMSALIKHITKEADENGQAVFLKPASNSLVDYYRKFGFNTDAYFRLFSLSPCGKTPLNYSELSHTQYNRMRSAAFKGVTHIKWDDAHIKWCIDENAMFSGKTLKIELDGKEYFLMGYPEKDRLIINETDLSPTQLKQLSAALCDVFGTVRLETYMPCFSCDEGETLVSSVMYNTGVKNAYVNLIMI